MIGWFRNAFPCVEQASDSHQYDPEPGPFHGSVQPDGSSRNSNNRVASTTGTRASAFWTKASGEPDERHVLPEKQPDAGVTDQTREALKKAEKGKTGGLAPSPKGDAAGIEAAEQEASDGPPGRGLAR